MGRDRLGPAARAGARRALSAAGAALALWLAAPALADPAPARAPGAGGISRELAFDRARVRISADVAATAIVDPVRVTVSVDALSGLAVGFADHGGRLGPFRVLAEEAGAPTWAGKGFARWQRRYLLAADEAGEAVIPPLPVFVEDTSPINYIACVTMRGCGAGHIPGIAGSRRLRTPPLALAVTSVLPAGADPTQPRPIAPPLPLPRPGGAGLGFLSAGLAVLALAGALAGLARWRLRRRAELPAPRALAHELALAALRRLDAELAAGGASIEQAAERLSAIVRRYLAGRFGLPAPARTTEEIAAAAAAGAAPLARRRQPLAGVLAHCDLVKFARHRPGAGEVRSRLETAIRFVEQTRDGAQPAPAGQEIG